MSSNLAAQAFAGGMLGALAVAIIVFYVLVVIACWKIFNKMGEPGWKSLIPIYNEYILFKNCWNTKMFWIMIALFVVSGILSCIGGSNIVTYTTSKAVVAYSTPTALSVVSDVVFLAGFVFNALGLYQVGKSFGHGVPFFFLSLFLPNIALLYLGFSKDEYQGNTTI